MSRSLVRLATLALVTCLSVPASAAEDDERRALASDARGSLANPRPLADGDALADVCAALSERGDPDDDAPPEAYTAAAQAVYRAEVPAWGFVLATRDGLALALERPLSALNGALDLSVLDRDAARFEVDADARAKILAAKRAKRLRLDVVFRLEGRDADIAPCRAVRGTYVLRAEPLSYALRVGDATLASTETPRLTALRRFVAPGAAEVRISARGRRGARDPRGVEARLRTEALQACLQDVVDSAAGTGMVALVVDVDRGGAAREVSAQLESFADDAVAPCVVAAVKAASLGAGPSGRLAVEIAVERGGADPAE